MRILVAAIWVMCAAACGGAAPRRVMVSDFETGLQGWWTLDEIQHAARSGGSRLLAMEHTTEAHSGKGAACIRYLPGKGWANAQTPGAGVGEQAANIGADELRLWFRGDGSSNRVMIGLQSWDTDFSTPLMFEVPAPLSNREWHELRIPLAEFAASNAQRPLLLRNLIGVQVDGRGEIAPAACWIDDVEFVNARDGGKEFCMDPLGDKLAALPVAAHLPRLGNWGWPGNDASKIEPTRAMGVKFTSWDGGPLLERQRYLDGFTTDYNPGRPSGADLIAGFGLTDADMDQDADGKRPSEGVESSIFYEPAVERFAKWTADRVATRGNAQWIGGMALSSPVSMYGEVHYPASTAGGYVVYGRAAQANFRGWVRRTYKGDLGAVSRAWGRTLAGWDEVACPRGPQTPVGGIDTRQEWSDFMTWYHGWLEDVSERCVAAARTQTGKPLALMCGGPKVGVSQGILSGNIGLLAKALGRHRPSFFNDTDSQTLFSARYTAAACHQYGVTQMLEHVGPPHLTRFHQVNMLTNVLATGAPISHLAHLGEGFDPNHWFGKMWQVYGPVINRYEPTYVPSDAAFFHSYLTARYRWERGNADTVRLYDTTNQLWFPDQGFPAWGRALGQPDVVDDVMIEDGGLKGRKILVIPNTSITVTSAKAMAAIRKWVQAGGTLVGFGNGCLSWTIQPDRSLVETPNMGGMMTPGAAETRLGRGRVLWHATEADPGRNPEFCREMMPVLEREAGRAGVTRWCTVSGGHGINVLYCGRDRLTGRHLFVAHLLKSAKPYSEVIDYWTNTAFDLEFRKGMEGEAELVAATSAFDRCEGGTASYDDKGGVLSVRFTLQPGGTRLKLAMGEDRHLFEGGAK